MPTELRNSEGGEWQHEPLLPRLRCWYLGVTVNHTSVGSIPTLGAGFCQVAERKGRWLLTIRGGSPTRVRILPWQLAGTH